MTKHPSCASTTAAPLVFNSVKFDFINAAWHLHNHLNQPVIIKCSIDYHNHLASEVFQGFNDFHLNRLVPLNCAIKNDDHKLGLAGW